jgi:hypothetical protein
VSDDDPAAEAKLVFAENQQLHAKIVALTSQLDVLEEAVSFQFHTSSICHLYLIQQVSDFKNQPLSKDLEEMSKLVEQLESDLDHYLVCLSILI